jgi:mediator of RNA polymerase II transcription subunit 5
MTFIYRYDLTYHDIGIGADTFVARLITKGHQSLLPDEMTEEQGKYLGKWLKGLYDSGNEGLSNDVFASCSPREFYFIVPTLFQQTVMALSAGILSFESVKGGMECTLLQTQAFGTSADHPRSHGNIPVTVSDRWPTMDVIICAPANSQ